MAITVGVDERKDWTCTAQWEHAEDSRPIIDVHRRGLLAALPERDAEVGTTVAAHVCDANRIWPGAAFALRGEARCRLVVKGSVAVTHQDLKSPAAEVLTLKTSNEIDSSVAIEVERSKCDRDRPRPEGFRWQRVWHAAKVAGTVVDQHG
jgi:hypothetical protein